MIDRLGHIQNEVRTVTANLLGKHQSNDTLLGTNEVIYGIALNKGGLHEEKKIRLAQFAQRIVNANRN